MGSAFGGEKKFAITEHFGNSLESELCEFRGEIPTDCPGIFYGFHVLIFCNFSGNFSRIFQNGSKALDKARYKVLFTDYIVGDDAGSSSTYLFGSLTE